MTSILVPVLYLAIVVGGMLSFSAFYRKRLAGQSRFRLALRRDF